MSNAEEKTGSERRSLNEFELENAGEKYYLQAMKKPNILIWDVLPALVVILSRVNTEETPCLIADKNTAKERRAAEYIDEDSQKIIKTEYNDKNHKKQKNDCSDGYQSKIRGSEIRF